MVSRRQLLGFASISPFLVHLGGCSRSVPPIVLDEPRRFPRRGFTVPGMFHDRLRRHLWMLFGEDNDLSVGSRLHRVRVLAHLAQHSVDASVADLVRQEVEALVNGPELSRRYGQPDVIYRSGDGYRFMCSKFSAAINRRSCPSHVFQDIAVLGELRVPSSQTVILSSGQKRFLWQGIEECARFVQLRDSAAMEPEWATLVFATYLDTSRPWSNRWGETIGISDWTEYVLGRDPSLFGCGGTHLFHSLAVLQQLDCAEGTLSDRVRGLLDDRIQQLIARIEENQNDAGTWPPGCLTDSTYNLDERIYSREVQDIFMAGHVLEALSMLHESNQVPDHVVNDAVGFLLQSIVQVTELSDFNYCPVTHGATVLLGGCHDVS